MKKFIAIVPLLSPFYLEAADNNSPGFSGEFSVLTGFSSKTSNFNTEDKNKTGTLNSNGDSDAEFIVGPLGQLRYTFGSSNNHQVFVGTSREDIAVGDIVLEFGYKMIVGKRSSIAFSYLPSLGRETWVDPFIVDEDREVTDISSDALRIKYSNILHSNISADIAYFAVDLDDEESGKDYLGSVVSDLDRDGDGIYSKLTYSIYTGRFSAVEPSIKYRSFNADGKAISNDYTGVGLSYKTLIDNHKLALSFEYGNTEHDGKHPIFNKEQEDTVYGYFAAYEYTGLMGWDNVGVNAVVGYNETTSNIEFYESNDMITGVGMSIEF